jgi:2-polyprenyl-6-methoxyphenol hydroxylase-like FAD-dependent oxidoreductase
MDAQVVIAGAGPVGLWLACELRLAGVSAIVLEQRAEHDPNSKALTVHPRTLEVIASRGLQRPFVAEGLKIPNGHFAVLDNRLDFQQLYTEYQFTLALLQARTEQLFEQTALERGADLRREHRVRTIEDTGDRVLVTVDGPDGEYVLAAEYIVGCDGTRSTVREAAGIAFVGEPNTAFGFLGDVVLDEPPSVPVLSKSTADGLLMMVPLPGGLYRIVGNVPEDVRTDWPGEFTLEELRARTGKIIGTDFGMHSPVWLSRYGNASYQAERYRRGRVLLAGDAAHQHMPAGGVGMNVGIQDAMNLGWKLAATVHGWAPDGLLDTYHAERHPVGADLLESTQAQTALITAFTPDGRQLRSLLSKLVAERPDFALGLAERLSGLAVRYPSADPHAHRLVGSRAPNLPTSDGTSLFTRLVPGRYVLLDLRKSHVAPLPTVPVAGRAAVETVAVNDVQGRTAWTAVRAALVRPDGYVAWASEEADDASLAAAVTRTLTSAGVPSADHPGP